MQAALGNAPAIHKPAALAQTNAPTTGETLVTPDRMDQLNKQEQALGRQAAKRNKTRLRAVATDPATNGGSALSAELQHQHASAIDATVDPPVGPDVNPPVGPDVNPPAVPAANPPTVPAAKRRRKAGVSTPMMPTTVLVQPSTSVIQCEGCIHGDLLEMKAMEPPHIKHYLKPEGFLHSATCAGDCASTIAAIHQASPKTNLFYCDETNKGFYAPDDDRTKAAMECGLILCSPCHATRGARYEQANAMGGTGSTRTSRRRCVNR